MRLGGCPYKRGDSHSEPLQLHRDQHDRQHAHDLAEARIRRRDAHVDERAGGEQDRNGVVHSRPREVQHDAAVHGVAEAEERAHAVERGPCEHRVRRGGRGSARASRRGVRGHVHADIGLRERDGVVLQ